MSTTLVGTSAIPTQLVRAVTRDQHGTSGRVLGRCASKPARSKRLGQVEIEAQMIAMVVRHPLMHRCAHWLDGILIGRGVEA